MPPKFGPSGNSDSFYEEGYKSSLDMPKWLWQKGLDAYEYSCSRGVNIKEDTAKKLGVLSKQFNIEVSIHAPYYINLASQESSKIQKSINYIIDSAMAAKWMGAKKVVFHPGSCGKIDRRLALNTAINSLKTILQMLKELKYDDILICPETMGKRNQLGNLDEVIELCKCDEKLIPTIDFGHLNALSGGGLKSKEDYNKILDTIKNSLGEYRLKNIHCHFSKIEYTSAGEKKHLTLSDEEYGPEFPPLAELIVDYDMQPVIICESRGTMAEDALKLKSIYESFAIL